MLQGVLSALNGSQGCFRGYLVVSEATQGVLRGIRWDFRGSQRVSGAFQESQGNSRSLRGIFSGRGSQEVSGGQWHFRMSQEIPGVFMGFILLKRSGSPRNLFEILLNACKSIESHQKNP